MERGKPRKRDIRGGLTSYDQAFLAQWEAYIKWLIRSGLARSSDVCPHVGLIELQGVRVPSEDFGPATVEMRELQGQVVEGGGCGEHRLQVLFLSFDFPDWPSTHANAIVVDHLRKTYERFEPHGGRPQESTGPLDTWMWDRFPAVADLPASGYMYLAPLGFCPLEGPQAALANSSYGLAGSCQVWTMLYMEQRITNPDEGRDVLARLLPSSRAGAEAVVVDYYQRLLALGFDLLAVEIPETERWPRSWASETVSPSVLKRMRRGALQSPLCAAELPEAAMARVAATLPRRDLLALCSACKHWASWCVRTLRIPNIAPPPMRATRGTLTLYSGEGSRADSRSAFRRLSRTTMTPRVPLFLSFPRGVLPSQGQFVADSGDSVTLHFYPLPIPLVPRSLVEPPDAIARSDPLEDGGEIVATRVWVRHDGRTVDVTLVWEGGMLPP